MVLPQTHVASASSRVVLLVPTCNPGPSWNDFLAALQTQTIRPAQVIVLDSESTDGSPQAAQAQGHTVQTVQRRHFNHGGTRQAGIDQHAHGADFAIFLTQDAILARPDALQQLLAAFDDPQVAATYGRQLPHANATPIAAHARHFNYPAQSHTYTLQDKTAKGLKTCFLSNSFAAYRLSALKQVGGFEPQLILGEDMHLAARLLLAGHAIRYQASAHVYHSHNYSIRQELARYFDTGVFHTQQKWLIHSFGNANREGFNFLKSEIKATLKLQPVQLFSVLMRTAAKYFGYYLGRRFLILPIAISRNISMHKGYWG